MTHIIHKELSYTVRGILLEIYNKLGPMLPEEFYQKAVTYRLGEQHIACTPEKEFLVFYRDQLAGKYYVDHWLEEGKIILELKVAPQILPAHQAQTLSYLKLTNADLAILVNFGEKSLSDKRLPNFLRGKKADFHWQPYQATEDLLYPELTEQLFEILYRIHFTLGPGFIHRVYRQATAIELKYQGLDYERITQIPIYYDQHFLGVQNTHVIKVEQKILLGLFALKEIDEVRQVEMKARLRHLDVQLGLLANFYGEQLDIQVVRI